MWWKQIFLSNCNAGVILQAASSHKQSKGDRGESWLHGFVVHKDFINSSAFWRGGWEMKKSTAFRLTDIAVFFFILKYL